MHDSPRNVDPGSAPVEYFPPDCPWEEHDGHLHLVGMRCSACGTCAFPARELCALCGTTEGLVRQRLAPRGRLYTFSEVHAGPKEFPSPYVIGFVDLEDGVRVVARLQGSATSLSPDQWVEVTTGTVRVRANGTQVVSYQFRSAPA